MPKKYHDLILSTLKEHGAVLERKKTHQVWRFPDGKIYVQSVTPSDRRGLLNAWGVLSKLLNLGDPERGREGERRSRTHHRRCSVVSETKLSEVATSPSLSDQLREIKLPPPKPPPHPLSNPMPLFRTGLRKARRAQREGSQ